MIEAATDQPFEYLLHSVFAGISAIFTGLSAWLASEDKKNEEKLKFYSESIDNLRKEVSLFISEITVISLIWKSTLNAEKDEKLNAKEFLFFRKKYRKSYEKIFEMYTSIILRLKDNPIENILKEKFSTVINTYIGNNINCASTDINDYKEIISGVDAVINNDRNKIESLRVVNKRIQILLYPFILIAIFFALYFLFSAYSSIGQCSNPIIPIQL